MRSTRWAAATLAAAMSLTVVTLPAVPASAADCAPPGQAVGPVPWAQQLLAPERVWDFTRGFGLAVAVLDSGVDGNHPQLQGRVEAGFDAVAGSGAANSDCLGGGTQVAGVIAARQVANVGFVGVAPGVTIVPVRVVSTTTSGQSFVDPVVVARGIDFAVDRKVDVIDVSAVTYTDAEPLRTAVARALARGTVVVAAVGDLGAPQDANPTPYPAAYDGVIGVGAIDQSAARWPSSQHGSYVDVVAPGAGVATLQPGGLMNPGVNGTGVASGFVAAGAVLIRARRGNSMPPGEVARLIFATATPAPSSVDRGEYGNGVVNPYEAINGQLTDASPAPLPVLVRPAATRDAAWVRSRNLALAGAGAALLAVTLVLAIAVAIPRGRRRFWRPALAAPPPSGAEPAEPSPPRQLFDDRVS